MIEHARGGEVGKLGARVDAEFIQQRGDMKLYGAHADGKLRRDFLVGEIFRDGAENFAFART